MSNNNLKELARELRNNSTLGEIILWKHVLRAKKMYGYQFNRQLPIRLKEQNIIVDFISRKLKLIIEVDGYSHNFKQKEDFDRDVALEKMGYTVLRILESDVKQDLNNVIRVIEATVFDLETSIPPAPFSKGE